jgi:hypothetical protein
MYPLHIEGIPRIIFALLIGFVLGFILIKSKLALRKTLIDQFSFKDNTFAITVLVSMVVGVPLFYFFAKYNLIQMQYNNYQFWAVIVGAVVTGLGVSFCGHIPVTAIASFGTGKLYSLWILLGMLAAFPVLKLIRPIMNDYVFGKKAPMNVNVLAQSNIFYDGKTTMLYTIPIVCLILALFLRLIQPRGK